MTYVVTETRHDAHFGQESRVPVTERTLSQIILRWAGMPPAVAQRRVCP